MKKFKTLLSLIYVTVICINLVAAQSQNIKPKLLVNGQQAFPQLIQLIQSANSSILINMFIWRDDEIGNKIASEIISAADRGVKITISKDTYGSVCEHAEESGTSFFHKKLTASEKIKVQTLKILYNPEIAENAKDAPSPLYEKIMSHPNITVEDKTFKADHSKFYIFDEEKILLGGVNIEDKENGQDMSGRKYQDYMLLLTGKNYVENFYFIREHGISNFNFKDESIYFGLNRKFPSSKKNIFEMEKMYLDLINSSEKELTIVMAYFSPLKNFISAINDAANRGVKVRIILPASANFQDDSNKATAKKLLKLQNKNKSNLEIYFSPDMLHTKLVSNEKMISFGSCNITKKAFHQLDELNVFITNPSESHSDDLYHEILNAVEKTISDSEKCESYKNIHYRTFVSFLEGFFV